MFIKEIIVNKFKSFADKSSIQFGDGVNIVLGPNGCGKSNIIDSIRWVLGEKRNKALRASKSEDVIFNGTEERSPANVAEVTFHVSNEPKVINSDLPEVVVTRKIFRSGESFYYINKQECRLKDIQDLFADTGVGKGSYSIMQQGQIDQILSSKHDERRMFFEEAAGIARSKSYLKESEQKLQKTDENIARLNDLMLEVKNHMDSLKFQADKALQYRGLKEKIWELDNQIQGYKYKQILEKIRNSDEKGKAFEEKIKAHKEEINQLYDEEEEVITAINTNEEKMSELDGKERELEIQEVRLNGQIVQLRGEHERLKSDRQGLIQKKEELERRHGELETYFSQGQEELYSLDEAILERESDQEKLNLQLFELDERIREIGDKIISGREENRRISHEVQSIENKQKDVFSQFAQTLEKKRNLISSILKEKKSVKGHLNEELHKLAAFFEKWQFVFDSQLGDWAKYPELGAELSRVGKLTVEFRASFAQYEELIQGILDFFEKEGAIVFSDETEFRLKSLRNQLELTIQSIQESEEELENKRRTRDTILKVNSDNQINLNRFKERKISLLSQGEKNQQDMDYLVSQISQSEAEIESCDSRMEETESMVFEQITKYEEMRERKKEIEHSKREYHDAIMENTDALHHMQSRQKELSAQMEQMTSRMDKLVIDYKENLIKKEMLESSYFDKYSKDINDIDLQSIEELDQNAVEKEIRDSRTKLETMGNVNLLAIDEYEEVKDRYDFMLKNRLDLEQAKADLEKLIRKGNTEATNAFLHRFE